ncbi:FRG domain-containing protein [Lonepinella sp. BR2271]|uniref:FRG domain-containing protein n=1 Tax=Lonepinella sp. BR2271 TaxID=3434550 RepID=UPI003F6E08B5
MSGSDKIIVKNIGEIPLYSKENLLNGNGIVEEYSDGRVKRIKSLRIEKYSQLEELFKQIIRIERKRDLYFRGQSNSNWDLESTLEREINKNIDINEITQDTYRKISEKQLENFKELIKGKLKEQSVLLLQNNLDVNNELWAIGQHLGLSTPLIDWTKSIYIALFFAFYKEDYQRSNDDIYGKSEYRSIYQLASDFFKSDKLGGSYLVIPKADNYKRLTAQKGLLTYWGIEDKINETLSIIEGLNDERVSYGNRVITKFYIHSRLRNKILEYLEHLGFTEETIFPDLQGAIQKCNSDLQKMLKSGDY